MPEPIQRFRRKGWRKPDGAVIVTRPSRFGNPFTAADVVACGIAVPETAREAAVEMFAAWLDCGLGVPKPPQERTRVVLLAHLHQLVGRDLACYCPLPEPGERDVCHRRVLMERANRPRTPEPVCVRGGPPVPQYLICATLWGVSG